MFKLSEIKELIKLVDQTSLQEIEIESEGSRILIRKPNRTESVVVATAPSAQGFAPIYSQPAAAVPAAIESAAPAVPDKPQAEPAANLHKVISPMVGTFYRSPSPGAPSFVNVGDKVSEKTVICIVEAMKLMNEIEAEVRGEVVEVLVENGQLVEYGQPLFLVRTE
jgi:acetyl-CoA carboxylase biotin carboxyl carrier protein